MTQQKINVLGRINAEKVDAKNAVSIIIRLMAQLKNKNTKVF